MSDDLIEEIANAVETLDILDAVGVWAKRKRDRERAQFRMEVREELKRELGSYIRSFKSNNGNNPIRVLREIAETEASDHEYAFIQLNRAWPLAWRGLCNIYATIKCNSNSFPQETRYKVTLTDRGREFLAKHTEVEGATA